MVSSYSDFVDNHLFMNLFNIGNVKIVKACRMYLAFDLLSVQIRFVVVQLVKFLIIIIL